ncbi:MAG: ABC transporter permease [Desulfurococcaceae archaeon]
MQDALVSMVYRQLKRWINSRSRLLSVIVQPLLWLIFLGMGFGKIFDPSNLNSSNLGVNATALPAVKEIVSNYFSAIFGGLDYVTYLISGMIAMTAFMGSFISGISVIWDKQFGFLKETLVAPAPRSAIIIGRIVGDALITTIQSLIIVLLAFVFTGNINILGIPLAMLYIFMMSIGFTSIGTVISLKFQSVEGFQILVNIMIMPFMFASGVFYPVNFMPDWMQLLSTVNPLTYAVHGTRYWLTKANVGLDYLNPIIDATVLLVTALYPCG